MSWYVKRLKTDAVDGILDWLDPGSWRTLALPTSKESKFRASEWADSHELGIAALHYRCYMLAPYEPRLKPEDERWLIVDVR